MRQLMISLDKKILDPNSAVARRMVEYGQKNELFIIIPDSKKMKLELSPTVHVETSGGWCKKSQFFKLRRLGLHLIKEKNIEEITAQDPFFAGWVGVWLKKKTGVRLELQVHGDFFSGNYYRRGSLGNRIRYFLARRIIHRADSWRTVGERVKMSLVMLGIPEAKIIVRPVPIDAEKIKNYIPKINLHEKYPGFEKIFLCLGRLDPVKNIPWLVKIFSEVVKSKFSYLLLIVGDGSEQKNIAVQIQSLNLGNNIKMESWTNDPWSYVKTVDCMLFPSLSESYGLVAMEAYAAGTPIIMSDVGVANYELKPSDKAEPRTVQPARGTDAWVKILPINDKEKWLKTILEF